MNLAFGIQSTISGPGNVLCREYDGIAEYARATG